jgi:hypothetical protein
MGSDEFIDNAEIRIKSREGCFLVLTHEPRIPGHIGDQYGGKTTFHALASSIRRLAAIGDRSNM